MGGGGFDFSELMPQKQDKIELSNVLLSSFGTGINISVITLNLQNLNKAGIIKM